MSDLISRDAVMLRVREFIGNPTYNENMLVNDLNALPTVKPERRWIPVTERLPEEEKDVLVSVHFDGHKGSTVNLPPSDYVEIASHVDGIWSSLSDEYKVAWKKHYVVAWSKLPEPAIIGDVK